MDILIIGLGVIGTTYGFVFKQAGHNVEHYIREGSKKRNIKNLSVSILDGRKSSKKVQATEQYTVQLCSRREYDLILVSVAQGKVANVMQDIKNARLKGAILLCCNLWYDKHLLDEMMQGYDYILGFPVAGGRLENKDGTEYVQAKLNCCLFDHFILETECKANVSNYGDICRLFISCNIKLEKPHDMLEWIWIHMAINAAVISVTGKYGDIRNSTDSARKLMSSVPLLATVIKTIRETTRIAVSRGIDMKQYRNELWIYKLPAYISAYFMKLMFARNCLTRRIMELHDNTADLLYICESVYNEGKLNNVPAPIFYHCVENITDRIKKVSFIE